MNTVGPPWSDPLSRPTIDLHGFAQALFPIPRSLTGHGVRATLQAIAARVPLRIVEVPTGTPVLDWEVPDEWNIYGATIRRLDGEVVLDFAKNNLHVLGYSVPIHRQVTREELARHVHTLPNQPDLIPYRTGYFARTWGFCLSDRQWVGMNEPAYRVDIDSTLAPGSLTYGEVLFKGSTDDEILISVHVCHPSLANDNLSSIAIATALAMREAERGGRRLGVRFLFLPATIGAITWLAGNEERIPHIQHGLVLTCLGDEGRFHYKHSRSGAEIDRAVEQVLQHSGLPYELLPFSPYGYDERQYCSPGFDLPVGCLMRSVHGSFPEYHTSDDNLDFITSRALDESYGLIASVLDLLQDNRTYSRVDGRAEPQLGRRGLYRAIAGQSEGGGATQHDLLWFLNLADGRHSLLDMARRAGIPFPRIAAAARIASDALLVEEIR